MSRICSVRERAPFELPHQLGLHAFHVSLTNPRVDLDSEEAFWGMLSEAVRHFDVIPRELAQELNVNLSTVNRWCNGKSAPHLLVRKAVHSIVLRRVEEQIESTELPVDAREVESFAEDALSKSLAAV